MSLSVNIDFTDHFSDKEIACYLTTQGWTCLDKRGASASSKNDDDDDFPLPPGVSVNYGLGLKDEEMAQAMQAAFEKHGYSLIQKLAQLC